MSVIDTLVLTASDVEWWISYRPASGWLSMMTQSAITDAIADHKKYGGASRKAADARLLAEQHIQNDLDRALIEAVTIWYWHWEEKPHEVLDVADTHINRTMYEMLRSLADQQSPTRTTQIINQINTVYRIREKLTEDDQMAVSALLALVRAEAEEADEGIDDALAELAEPFNTLRRFYERPSQSKSTPEQEVSGMSLKDITITEVDVTLWKNPQDFRVLVRGVKQPLVFKERFPASMTEEVADAFLTASLTTQLDVLMGLARPTAEEKEQLTRARYVLEKSLVDCLEVWVPRALLTFKYWAQERWAPISSDGSLIKWVVELSAAYRDPDMRGRASTLTSASGAIVDLSRMLGDSKSNTKDRVKASNRWVEIFNEAKQYQLAEDKEDRLDKLFEEIDSLVDDVAADNGGYYEVRTVEIDPGVLAAIQWFWYWSNQSEGKSEQEIEYYSGVLQFCDECAEGSAGEDPPEGLKEALEFLLDRISSIVETLRPKAKKFVQKKLAQCRKFKRAQLTMQTIQYRSLQGNPVDDIVRKTAWNATSKVLEDVNDKIANSVKNKEPSAMSKPSMTLRELIDKLSDSVYGNQRVKEAMATCIRYRYLMGNVRNSKVQLHPTNLLISGGTGSGKTELIKALGKVLDIPVISVVATQFSETGYVGGDLDEIIKDLNQIIGARAAKGKSNDAGIENLDDLLGRMMRENKRESSASKADLVAYRRAHPVLAIVFIDEIDKLIEGEGQGRDRVSRMGVQRSLLGMISGVPIDRRELLTTADVLWISAGAFSVAPMTGLLPELLGRFNIRVATDPVTADNMEQVLNNPRMSPAHSWVEVLKQDGVTVKLEKSGLRAMAELAAARNQQYGNLGMRQLATIATEIFQPLMLNPPTEKVVFDAEYVKLHHPV